MIPVLTQLGPYKVFRYSMAAGDQFIYQVKDPAKHKARTVQSAEQIVTRGQLTISINGPVWDEGNIAVPFTYTSTISAKTAILEYRPNQNWAGPIQVVQTADVDSEYICVSSKEHTKHVAFKFEVAETFNVDAGTLIIPMNDCILDGVVVEAFTMKLVEQASAVTQQGKVAVYNIV